MTCCQFLIHVILRMWGCVLSIVLCRCRGMSDIDAIVSAFAHTAGIITSAGVIMVIAFGSMMLSSQMLLVETGFYLSFSIFLDTFVVRTVVCPALMAILGPANWWPRNMPPITMGKRRSPEPDSNSALLR